MKMKKALSIFLGGAVLVGSSSFIFANDALKLANEVHEQPAVSTEVSLESTETTETPTVTIEVLDALINNPDEIVIHIDDEELEELIDKILDELEEENETEEEIDEDDDDDDEVENDEDEENDEEDEENNALVLENLYHNLLKYQLVYNRVPTQAKPAIEKNMKNMQLKIIAHMVEMNEELVSLIPEINVEEIVKELSALKEKLENQELTEEEKQELVNSISSLEMKIANYNEMVALVDFVNSNENWEKELKNKVHAEFKEEKSKVKAEDKLAKEEIKQAREDAKEKVKQDKKALQEQMKSNKKVDKNEKIVEADQTINTKTEIKVKNDDKKFNDKIQTKSNPAKKINPGKGNGKNK